MSFLSYKRNRSRLDRTLSELVDKYESTSPGNVSCKSDLLREISLDLDTAKDEIGAWNDSEVDYISIAHGLLRAHADNLLTSGRYHLGSMLNPMTCARSLMHIYTRCLDYCVETGLWTQEERDAEYSSFIREMRSF